ncbi:ABC transporter ATP-binding protein [Mycobacterium antarcticum]|uniref:metal ABC transporter ATP-binding protein n=1 Tax=unclassified Mycolicibacterium TaxID=2636767 RepID=UPI00238D25A2|nr:MULTISPECIES: ABC transporter ATP-binding protein [unclassified Mycolicibacterium]BDX33481.1 ABC transporter ATP-binding protein [Mycolicibacterium sp. TUM20985]GLP82908.1 ABC transporter ATP-binding protein [Mycolicibacterium sp. TUM20984]
MSPSSTAADDAALTFDDVSAVRGRQTVWSQGSFTVPAGGIVAVIGSNGSGKTTLLQMILGLIPAATGRLGVFGRRPGDDNDSIGYVPQNYAASAGDAIRACDAVLLGLTGRRWAFGRATSAQRRRVADTLASVGAADLATKRLSTLSGGQRQRVAIAEALVAEPKMLILDEPLASLDLRNQREIVELLARLHRELSVTILVVAHDLNPLLPILTSAIYLLDGHAHYAPMDDLVDETLLSHLYGTPIEVAHTPQGALYMRSVS